MDTPLTPPTPWAGSTRRYRLPPNWVYLRNQVKARANNQCEAKLQNGSQCPDQGTDCDHIVAGDNHELSNLQWLCKWHHKRKSAQEGQKASMRISEKHPTRGKHPGLN